jgi:hypothetical protein
MGIENSIVKNSGISQKSSYLKIIIVVIQFTE